MKLSALILIFLTVFQNTTSGQNLRDTNTCSANKQKKGVLYTRTSVASNQEEDYDVQYVKFDIALSDVSTYIEGNVLTYVKVVSSSLSEYVFELSKTLNIDSVQINGILRPFDTANNICTVSFSSSIEQNTVFSARVYYHGYPPPRSSIYATGFQTVAGVTFSTAEPYQAFFWWPCKQSLTDKIDSVDMWVTVPYGAKVGSNGLLTNITAVGSGQQRYEWKERYPIDYYLISVAVSKYYDTSFYMHFTGSNDSMLIMNYLSPSYVGIAKPMLDSTSMMINYFSTLFGRYPFWKEKYGHSLGPSSGSMENQTMTTTNFGGVTIIAHELAHQWFGDNVTCGTWRDIWLNEGFATYGQYLFHHQFNGAEAGLKFLANADSIVLSKDTGSVYVTDTTAERIFDSRLSYKKGAVVIHMLRAVINDDSTFFRMLRNYQEQFAGKTATTDQFKNIVEQTTSRNFDTFFNQWIYGQGFPRYGVTWNQINNVLFLQINQSTSDPASVFFFTTPIDVLLYSQQGDTIIRIYENQPSQAFQILSNKIIDSIAIDPNHWLLHKLIKEITKDGTINTLPSTVTVFPNPVKNTLFIAYKNLNNPKFILYDVSAKKVLEQNMQYQAGIAIIDVSRFCKGVYVYKVIDGNNTISTGRILKE